MDKQLTRSVISATLCSSLLLAGCSGMSVWPFDDKKSQGPKSLANAVEYQCEGGKRFHVRFTDNASTAWLIYNDREVALSRSTANSDASYTNGVAVLTLSDKETTLMDGPAIAYRGCQKVEK